MRAAFGADDVYGVSGRLRRIVREKLPGGVEILIGNLNPHTSNGVRVEPVHLNEMFILNVCRNTRRLQASAKKMRLFRFAECGDRFQERVANA